MAGDVHAANAALSSLQRNVTPTSVSVNPKLALAVLTRPVGPQLIEGTGGAVVSIVNELASAYVTPVWAFAIESVACTCTV